MKKTTIMMLSLAAITLSPVYAQEAGGRGGQRLQEIDTNSDGVISKSEFLAHSAKEAEQRFNKMDTNSDGQLSKEELAAVRDKLQELRDRRSGNR